MTKTLKCGTLVVKRELSTKFEGFCTVCGTRYEAGSNMVALTTEPSARGKIAHSSCVARHNTAIEKAVAKDEAARGRRGFAYEGVEYD